MRTLYFHLAVLAGALALAAGPTRALAQEAETAPDDSWVSVSGTVVSTTPSAFRLDHGTGLITVEMDDFDFFGEGRGLMVNDQVVVYGRVDDDLFERRTIEASSVYVESLGTHFYASALDEEDFGRWTVAVPIEVGLVEVTGTVTAVTGRELTISTGATSIQVDTNALTYDPLDDRGYQQIDIGDRVKVSGQMEGGIIDDRELEADWIINYES